MKPKWLIARLSLNFCQPEDQCILPVEPWHLVRPEQFFHVEFAAYIQDVGIRINTSLDVPYACTTACPKPARVSSVLIVLKSAGC